MSGNRCVASKYRCVMSGNHSGMSCLRCLTFSFDAWLLCPGNLFCLPGNHYRIRCNGFANKKSLNYFTASNKLLVVGIHTNMKRFCFLLLFFLCLQTSFAQTDYPKSIDLSNPYAAKTYNKPHLIEAYAVPFLFTAKLSSDSLVPPSYKNGNRLGDGASYGVQYGQLYGEHILIKAGLGFSTREYSLVKYNLDDLFTALFLFDSPYHVDSFAIARVQYKLNYLDIPLTIAYERGRRAAVQLSYGLTARLQFATNKKATITPDYSSPAYVPSNLDEAEDVYKQNVNSFVISVEPYGDLSFRIYKGFGIYFRLMPFSFYASSLDHRISTSETEFLGSGFGATYRF